MKVILFSLLALILVPTVQAANETYDYAQLYPCEKRFAYPYPIAHLDDTQYTVRINSEAFEALVTTVFNAANTNLDPFFELLHRIKSGKICHNNTKKYTRMTHKDFYYRLLPYLPFESCWTSDGVTTSSWTYIVKLNGKHAYLHVTIWGHINESADERIIVTYFQ